MQFNIKTKVIIECQTSKKELWINISQDTNILKNNSKDFEYKKTVTLIETENTDQLTMSMENDAS